MNPTVQAANLFKKLVKVNKRLLNCAAGRDLFLRPELNCPTITLGNLHAQWCISPLGICDRSVVYSFGVGEDVSFDLAVIQRFGATVHAFDPTPRAKKWISKQSLPNKFVFHDYGIAAYDGLANFCPPRNPAYVSYTMVSQTHSADVVQGAVYRLTTIAGALRHQTIDILKIDIEGGEYAVLRDILSSGVRINQLLVEFHHRRYGAQRTRAAIAQLNQAGFRIFAVSESGEELSFKNARIS